MKRLHEPERQGESLSILERLIVAPTAGRFRPDDGSRDGGSIVAGESIGVLEARDDATAVISPFSGELVGLLARDGERVRPGEPLAWLRIG